MSSLTDTKLRDITIGQLILLCVCFAMIGLAIWVVAAIRLYVMALTLWLAKPFIASPYVPWRAFAVLIPGLFLIWRINKTLHWPYLAIAYPTMLLWVVVLVDNRAIPLLLILPALMIVAYLRKKILYRI